MRNLRALSLAPLLLAACSSAPPSGQEPLSETSEAIVNTSNTVPTYTLSNAYPPALSGDGAYWSAARGSFYNGVNDASHPVTSFSTWQSSWNNLQYLVSPALTGYLNAASTQAGNDDTTLSTGSLQSIFTALQDVVGGTPSIPTPSTQFYGYSPQRAQWVRQAFLSTYPDPDDLLEQRERGARLYCAARYAQSTQPKTTMTMGSQAAFSLNVLGQQIDFLVTEPTVEIGSPVGPYYGPSKFVGTTADGAQAFEVPLQFGTRFTPIRGVGLPGLAEVRYPVVLTTGDSEAITRGQRSFFIDTYVTVSHSDSIQEQNTTASMSSNSFPLFTIGTVTVNLTWGDPGKNIPGLVVKVGAPSNPDHRVFHGPPAGFLQNERTGRQWTNGTVTYSDEAQWINAGNTYLYPSLDTLSPWSNAAATRLDQDDDHEFWGTNSVTLTAGVEGVLGIDLWGAIQAGLTVSGSFSGTATQDHILQDALIAEKMPGSSQFEPATALNVRPHSSASARFNGISATLSFSISLPWPIGTLSWQQTLFDVGAFALASYDSDTTHAWPESSNLRIGTWSPSSVSGSSMKQPTVYSHLPGNGDFQSFATETVDQCLSDSWQNTAPPPACAAQPATGGTPNADLCVFASDNTIENYGTAVCGADFDGWVAAMSPSALMNACTATLLQFLCSKQSWIGGDMVSHVMGASDYSTFGSDLGACLDVGATIGVSAAVLKEYAKQFQFIACSSNGAPIWTPVAGVGNPSSPPPVGAATSCQ